MCLFSIITVCLNAEDKIKNTISSVLEQDCDNFEYIIQDGESNDQTIKIAESFAVAFGDRGIPFLINSQRDRGIYDAMNIAMQEAQGEWIIYMNAGDYFADGTVLSRVIRNANFETADIVYGDVILRDNNLYMYQKARNLDNLRFGMPFCHQSAFTRKTLLRDVPFSLEYRICSDYLFYLKAYLAGKEFAYIPMAISVFDVNGLSSDNDASYKERLKIREKMPVRDEKAKQIVNNWQKKEAKKKFIPLILRKIRCYFLTKKRWKTEEKFFLHNK